MRTNDLILADARSDLFVTIFYIIVDASSEMARFANAGHNPTLVVRAASPVPEYLTEHGMALGVMPDIRLEEQGLMIGQGDVVVLYTDGVTEALNATNEEFGLERLERCVTASLSGSADDIAWAIRQALREHVGDEPPFDDITFVVVKRVNE